MLKYEFERVDCAVGGYSLFGGGAQTHREIIQRRAAEGWRFAGCIPAAQRAGVAIESIDLVFEREEE